jgi:hypothetical protein
MNIAQQRLLTQRLAGPGFATPADAVRWFSAADSRAGRAAATRYGRFLGGPAPIV